MPLNPNLEQAEPKSQADWQATWIASNLVPLGYNAWLGYTQGERGVVVCSTTAPQVSSSGESFPAYYVPRSRLAAFLNAWLAAPDTVILRHHFMNAHILETVDTYDPTTEVVMLLQSFEEVTFFYLRNLPVPPPQAYDDVCRQWTEFAPSKSLKGLT